MAAILEIRRGTKEYRGIPAVKAVTFALERGRCMPCLVRTVPASRR